MIINLTNNISSSFPKNIKNSASKPTSIQQKSTTSVYNVPFWCYKANAAINFSGRQSFNDFSKWLKDKKLSPEAFIKSVKESNIYLGEGTSCKVFGIPGNENYVVKFPLKNVEVGPLKEVLDEFPELNIGQAIATIGNIKISKRQSGIEAGIPYKARQTGGIENVFTYLKHLSRTANMPQSAYDELAFTFKKLNEHDLYFDLANPNNILVDEKNKKFNLVDDLTEITHEKDYNNFLSLAAPLVDTFYARQLSYNDDLTSLWNTIVTKCIIASKKAGLPAPTSNLATLKFILDIGNIDKRTYPGI